MFERLYLCFRGPCSLIQHNKTIRENLELCSKLQIEISHNQLSGRHIEIPTPEFLMILFVWNYLIILNEWLKCTPRPENCIQYHQCYCLIRNSQMSHLAHLPLTLKSPPSHTDHHPYFLPIFPIFYHNFPFRNTLISIFGNVIWTLKKSPPPPNIIPIFFYDCPPYFFYLT